MFSNVKHWIGLKAQYRFGVDAKLKYIHHNTM